MRKTLLSTIVVAFLAACGGGGGGGDTTQSLGPLPITSSNYVRVAQESLSSASYLIDASALIVGVQTLSDRVLLDFARLQARKLPRWFKSARALAAGADISELEPCSGGGSVAVTLHDLNGNQQPDAGESASIVAAQCVEMDATIDGRIDMAINALSGDILNSSTYTMNVTMTLIDLAASAPGGSVSGSGTMTLSIVSTDSDQMTVGMSVPALSMSGSLGGSAFTRSLQNFAIDLRRSPSGFDYADAVTVSGTISGSGLDGKSVTLATISPVVQFGSDPYPRSGQVTASGASGSKMRLTVQDSNTVLLELDADGNGTYEISVVKTWGELI